MKKNTRFFLLSLLAAVLFITACSNDCTDKVEAQNESASEAEASGYLGLSERQAKMIAPLNDFALSLFRQASMQSSGRSALVSPLSAAFVLGMVGEGATGDARQEILDAMGMDNGGFDAVSRMLGRIAANSASVDAQVAVAFANNITVKNGFKPSDSYVKAVRDNYGASVLSMDFSSHEAVQLINAWSREQSHGLIPELVDRLDPLTVMCVLNATYFKGAWKDAFDKSLSKSRAFYDGSRRKGIMMMHRTANAEYCEQEGFKALRLPFGNGRFAMTFILADKQDGLSQTLESLSGKSLAQLPFEDREVDMTLPVFLTESSSELKPMLEGMGIRKIFDPQQSCLTDVVENIGDNPLYVSLINQKASLGMNEEGSEGAAVTEAEIMFGADNDGQPNQRAVFCADHPFLYFVSEVSSGSIYLIGQFCGD